MAQAAGADQADLKGNGTAKPAPTSAAPAGKLDLDRLIAHHAAANNVPEALVRRVIKRESRGNPRAISKGNYGLMQIRLGTARALGYRGGIEGLLDADTNMTYAVKYLAGAYRAAEGNLDRAVHYYAAGYYYAAKRKGLLPGNPLKIFEPSLAKADAVVDLPKTATIAPLPPRRPGTEAAAAAPAEADAAAAVPVEVDSAAATEPTPTQIVDRFNVK
ncbi:MAG: transglycosylase SLT domain-containing protein [Rhodopseudomonas sp.]|nr:transglycosylase SLT domain-containing protein [Rhodopseudomonas sp.]